MSIEISLLLASFPIDAKDIEIGKHGLVVESGSRQRLLLPQVAAEHRLSTARFLEETCRKAGLAPAAWTRPVNSNLRVYLRNFSRWKATAAAV